MYWSLQRLHNVTSFFQSHRLITSCHKEFFRLSSLSAAPFLTRSRRIHVVCLSPHLYDAFSRECVRFAAFHQDDLSQVIAIFGYWEQPDPAAPDRTKQPLISKFSPENMHSRFSKVG
jgi:hypothetical protein